jgi:ethanolamine utilization protein EutA (predicted chaperonin)
MIAEFLKVRKIPIIKMERHENASNVIPLIKQMILKSRELLDKVRLSSPSSSSLSFKEKNEF